MAREIANCAEWLDSRKVLDEIRSMFKWADALDGVHAIVAVWWRGGKMMAGSDYSLCPDNHAEFVMARPIPPSRLVDAVVLHCISNVDNRMVVREMMSEPTPVEYWS